MAHTLDECEDEIPFTDPPHETDSQECLRLLHEIDEDMGIIVTSWEADFLESIFTQNFPLTQKQIDIADRMIDIYL